MHFFLKNIDFFPKLDDAFKPIKMRGSDNATPHKVFEIYNLNQSNFFVDKRINVNTNIE